MYLRPQWICVAGLCRQSLPLPPIFEPGSACGMPYAPDEWLYARWFQLLSLVQSLRRQSNWLLFQPCADTIGLATAWLPGLAEDAWATVEVPRASTEVITSTPVRRSVDMGLPCALETGDGRHDAPRIGGGPVDSACQESCQRRVRK
jgi:hypothetical protein